MAQQKTHRLQYTELWEAQTGLTFGVKDLLFDERSPYQHVQVFETDAFGRLLTLDGLVMLTERDEFVYHEMIAHPALCLLEAPRRVLVVGGGDGGTAREVLRHPGVERIDLVEIDRVVVEAARRFFPAVSAGLDDPRLSLHLADGVAFVRDAPDAAYDLVVVDSTDPVDFAEGLFGEAFYRDVARTLTAGGILASQTESPFDRRFRDAIRQAHEQLGRLFPEVHAYLAGIPTYPMGTWSFTLASKHLHPVRDFDAARAAGRLAAFEHELRYYNPDVHSAAFALPNFVRAIFG